MPLSELLRGQVLREPPGKGNGYWAGAPGVFYSTSEKAWYLTYRLRRPRGINPDRGGEARIARSTDLMTWRDVWSITKDQLRSASIERCALRQASSGQWHYFISYVDPDDGRWCLSVLTASSVQQLSPATLKPLFKANDLGLEGIKDPWIIFQEGQFHMFLSVALRTTGTTEQSHASLDIFNTGECASATGLATSSDLETWQWQGVVFSPTGRGWDAYCRRIGSIIPSQKGYVAFYDGSAGHHENYEERCGLALSADLKHWESVSTVGPAFTSADGTGAFRYIDAQLFDEKMHFFYELSRADQAHELSLARLNWEPFVSGILQPLLGPATHPG